MSTIDQCPSTKGKIEISDDLAGGIAGVAGRPAARRYWRSVEDFSNDPSFREFVHREFPAGASEIAFDDRGETRRTFLKLMGASLALAGAATIPGCRRPDEKILPYGAEVPEHAIPGKPLWFATSMPLSGGGAEGLLVETHQGRPTKIEGNPLHPINRGKTSEFGQASILEMYDPSRLKFPTFRNPTRGRLDATWDDFRLWWGERSQRHAADGGASLAVICEKKTSPTLEAMRDRFLAAHPNAAWVWWDPVDASRNRIEGTRQAFGAPHRVLHDLAKARCVLSLGADFMSEGPNHIPESLAFAATRRVTGAGEPMSRLYVAEPHPTGTGSLADHRFPMSPSQITAFAAEVARSLLAGDASMRRVADSLPGTTLHEEHVGLARKVAEDLRAHAEMMPGGSVVIAGDGQPAEVHALVAAVNASLGAPVTYLPMGEMEASDPMAGLTDLVERMQAGRIETLVTIGANPLYDAPVDIDFAGAFDRVGATIAWSVMPTETSVSSTWELNGASFLESWGDTEAYDGTVSPTQPMIAPLYEPALSDIEFVAMLAGEPRPEGYALTRTAWGAALGLDPLSPAFDKTFRRALHDGVLPNGARRRAARVSPRVGEIAGAASRLIRAAAPTPDGLEVVFETGRVGNGQYANNGWLQELPQKGTSVVWDNPVVLSPATARELRLLPVGGADGMYTQGQIPEARLAELTVDGVSMVVPVWICPGAADGVAHVQLGYGRAVAGLVGSEVGFNAYRLRARDSRMVAFGGRLERAPGTHPIASTQNHWSLEGRTSIVRAMDKAWYDKHAANPPKSKPDKIYGTERITDPLTVAEKIGELSHTPDNVSIYVNPMNETKADPAPGSPYSFPPQWGMTIDLASCTGCGVCTIACQSENNIPIVGRAEVAKGREMHWIRVDRYFAGEDMNAPDEMICQPVACVHCENAPCEVVCPVTATVHGPEGTNNMAYNRCIGTRYCANNCPYKVRRFNFFDWAQTKYNGSFYGEDMVFGAEGVSQRDFNKNFIPPRLREKIDEISAMRLNPDVTIRGRGVMEKCSYCIQRINAARQESKVRGLWTEEAPIPDGFFEVACQQACPTNSIVFGDLLNEDGAVARSRDSQRSYLLLGYLNTRPRTSYLMRVRNPNPDIRVFDEHDPLDHGGPGGAPGEHDHHEGGPDRRREHPEAPEPMDGGHSFVDPAKRFMDEGYRASLRVLS